MLCRVLVGDSIVGQMIFDKPQIKPDDVTEFDSFVDNEKNPTIVVVCRDYHAVPVWIVTFRRGRR